MERLIGLEERGPKNNNDLPSVHVSSKRKCDPDRSHDKREDEEEAVEDSESMQLLHPQSTESPTAIDIAAYKDFRKRMLGFYMKFILLVNSTICAVLHAQWANHVVKNLTTVLPFSLFGGSAAMYVYIILIYRWWHLQSKIWRKVFFLFLGALYCAVGALELYYLNTHSFSSDGYLYELSYITESQPFKRYNRHVSEEAITAVAVLSFIEAALCFIDAFFLT